MRRQKLTNRSAEGRWWTVDHVLQNVKKGSETRQSRIILRDLLTSAKKEIRVKSSEKVETVDIVTLECELVSRDGKHYTVKVSTISGVCFVCTNVHVVVL